MLSTTPLGYLSGILSGTRLVHPMERQLAIPSAISKVPMKETRKGSLKGFRSVTCSEMLTGTRSARRWATHWVTPMDSCSDLRTGSCLDFWTGSMTATRSD